MSLLLSFAVVALFPPPNQPPNQPLDDGSGKLSTPDSSTIPSTRSRIIRKLNISNSASSCSQISIVTLSTLRHKSFFSYAFAYRRQRLRCSRILVHDHSRFRRRMLVSTMHEYINCHHTFAFPRIAEIDVTINNKYV